jgi:hypothetical protein
MYGPIFALILSKLILLSQTHPDQSTPFLCNLKVSFCPILKPYIPKINLKPKQPSPEMSLLKSGSKDTSSKNLLFN